MIKLEKIDKEVNVVLTYNETVGSKPKVTIDATGDFPHHVIEAVFEIVDRLSRMERIGHNSSEWTRRK